jgi:hypothetical protein
LLCPAAVRTLAPLFLFLLFLLSFLVASPALGCGWASGESGFDTDAASTDGGFAEGASVTESDDTTLPPAPEDDDGDGGAANAPFDDAFPIGDDGGLATPLPSGPPFDAGEGGVCTRPLATGDLMIVELMIESTSGTGDHGEWIEVESSLRCAVNINGLSGNCPTGAKVNTFEVSGDLWIPPLGTFVIADSTDPAVNHLLPGIVIPWSAQPGDVLRNEGATVTLLMSGGIVDSVTYPDMKLTPGVSVAFPSDCPATLRPQWTAWQSSTSSWFPAFRGTPNAANDDVHCPVESDE